MSRQQQTADQTSAAEQSPSYSYTQDLLRLLSIEHNFHHFLREAINRAAFEFLTKMIKDDAALYLHLYLGEDDKEEHVRTLIQCVPGVLSRLGRNEDDERIEGLFPIHSSLLYPDSLRFIPLLAEEGIKHLPDGEIMKGGLLNKRPLEGCDYQEFNVLQDMAQISYDDDYDHGETDVIDVMNTLLNRGLLTKSDMKKHKLIYWSFHPATSKRFNYFADCNPGQLLDQDFLEYCCNHDLLECDLPRFRLFLTTSLRHFPLLLGGLLMQIDCKEITLFHFACKKYGTQDAWNAIRTYLDQCDGSRIILETKNPDTNMYPFIRAAEGDDSELNLVYYLLRRNPIIIESSSRADEQDIVVERLDTTCERTKRKRGAMIVN